MENPQAGQDAQMQQIVQMVQEMSQQGLQPVEIAQKLLEQQVPPEVIGEVFTQLGMQPEEVQQTIEQAMQGGQQPQGPGEEQVEGAASNPQEEVQEQVPAPGMATGGDPDKQTQVTDLTNQVQLMMQKGASVEEIQQQLIDGVNQGQLDQEVAAYVLQQLSGQQQPVARFGGNAMALIKKALGGNTPEVDPTSSSYVQDRQAAFIKSVKKNALMSDFENEFPSLQKTSKPKFSGGGPPKPEDYQDANAYKLALYEYNHENKGTKDAQGKDFQELDVKDLSSKWVKPIAEGTTGKWVGGKFVPDEPAKNPAQTGTGNAFTVQTPEQANLAGLKASPFGRFLSNSGWDHNNINWDSSGLPLSNDPNAKFNITHAEAKQGLFGRRKVSFDLDWSTQAPAAGTNTTPSATGTTPATPGTTTATTPVLSPEEKKKQILDAADKAYAQKGRLYKAFHWDTPSENAAEYDKEQAELKAKVEREKALNAADAYTGQRAFGGPSNDVVNSAIQVLKMALGGMTYKNSYEFLPKADEGMPAPTPTEGKGTITGKSKFKMDWANGMEAMNNGAYRFANFMEDMHQSDPNKNIAMHSALNTTRTGLNDQGNYNQWGEEEGGINRGSQVQNMGNTYGQIDGPMLNGWANEHPVFRYGGKTYDLGGEYDLSDDDLAALEAAGIKLEKLK
jgi:hypothetical protein